MSCFPEVTPSDMIRLTSSTDSNGVEEIHSVGTINNVETSYFTQLKICYLMTREKTELIYRVPCNNCSSSYVGETGRKFGLRINEHKNEVDSFTAGTQTRASGAGRAVQLTGRQSQTMSWKPCCRLEQGGGGRRGSAAADQMDEGGTLGREDADVRGSGCGVMPTRPRVGPGAFRVACSIGL